MTDQEKESLKAEIIEEITAKMKPSLMREETQFVLAVPRKKWFKDKEDGPMFSLFGTYVYYQVWESIRRLTCYICGKGYVRQLRDSDKADEVAEALCQLVFDLASQRRKNDA